MRPIPKNKGAGIHAGAISGACRCSEIRKGRRKTEREFYVDGINCNPSTARDQFVTVKEQFDKEDGIQAYHGYLSFKDEPNINPNLAQKIGMEFAKRVWGDRFQVVVTTHLNTKHLHCHFVVNSVSFVDGKRMANNEKHWRYFRHIADELCRQYQLDVIENPQRGTGKTTMQGSSTKRVCRTM